MEYRDAAEIEVGRIYRFENPTEGRSSKEYRPIHCDGTGWRVGDPPTGFPLYRLPEILQSSGIVFVTEGEKAADALAELGLTATTSAHGAKSANKADWSPLAGRDVYLLPDNDPPGPNGRVTGREYTDEVASCLLKLAPPARPRLLEFPGLPPKGDAFEFVHQLREAGKIDDEIRLLVLALAEQSPPYPLPGMGHKAKVDGLPRVFLPGGARNVRITDSSAELGRLLSERGDVFTHAGRLVRVLVEGVGKVLHLKPVAISALPAIFEHVASLYTTKCEQGIQIIAISKNCSKQLAELIAECQEFLDPLPAIRTLTQCPVMTQWEEKYITVAGYHRGTGIYAGGSQPHEVSLGEAVELLTEVLDDFRFVTSADRSRALAALVTPGLIQGGLLPGRAPITLFEADTSQAGKGYLAKVIAAVYGDKLRSVTQRSGGVGSIDESMSQYLMEGASFISFDNIRGKLDSPALESALTEDYFLARAPYSKAVRVDIRHTTFMMTSNMAELTPDLANRCNPVRLLKQPEGYQFKEYPGGRDVLEHVRHHQRRYLGAVFTVARAWVDAGYPRHPETRHDFRAWAGSLGWIVQNVFRGAPLCDGIGEAKRRMTTPALNWLREVARAVLQAEQDNEWLRTNQIVAILRTAEIEIPGTPEGADLDDEAVAKKAFQGTGSRLTRCFRMAERTSQDNVEFAVVQVENLTIQRRSQFESEQRSCINIYRFSVAAMGPDVVAADTSDNSSRLSSGLQSDTVGKEGRGYSAATPAAAKSQYAATAATGSEHFLASHEMTVGTDGYSVDSRESMRSVAAQPQLGQGVAVHEPYQSLHRPSSYLSEADGSESEEKEWTF